MNKFVIIACLSILFLSCAQARIIDKPIYNIKYCYNASFTIKLLDGNRSWYNFRDCTKTNGTWFCDCHNVPNYNLTLQSDENIPNDFGRNYYRIDINYSTYDLTYRSAVLTTFDYGDGFNTQSHDDDSSYKDFCINDVVYINQTVYVDRNVTVYVNNTVYVDRNITIPLYINNTIYVDRIINNTVYITNNTKYWFEFWR